MPLFGYESSLELKIVPSVSAPLSKDQKSFNNLIKKIQSRRASLNQWEAIIPVFRQQYVSDLLPLQEEFVKLQCEFVTALDVAHGLKGVTKGERRKLSHLIVTLAEQILMERDTPEIKDLFNKHAMTNYDEEQAAMFDGLKSMLESSLGVELDDDVDLSSPESFRRYFEQKMQAEQAESASSESNRKKNRRAEAKATRKEAEERQLSQSIREVFRKLASALHPDREPDPDERERKTALMQKANVAYENGNLLQLLELQLELEQINHEQMAGMSPERLKHYIKILKGQVADLDAEINGIKFSLKDEFGMSPYRVIQPEDLLSCLQSDARINRTQIQELRQQIELASDAKELKAWLKTISLSGFAF